MDWPALKASVTLLLSMGDVEPQTHIALSPSAGTLGNIVLPLQAGPLHFVPWLGQFSLGLLGTPPFIEHVWQVGCVHLSELLIVA